MPSQAIAAAARTGSSVRLEQDHVQAAAMDAHLGILISAEFSARLLVDQLAETVEETAFEIFDPGAEQFVGYPERRELPHGMRQQRDADAELLYFRRALIDAAGNAAPMQIEREREAGDATADDRNVRGTSRVAGIHRVQ